MLIYIISHSCKRCLYILGSPGKDGIVGPAGPRGAPGLLGPQGPSGKNGMIHAAYNQNI